MIRLVQYASPTTNGNVGSATITINNVQPGNFLVVGVSGYYSSISYVRDTTVAGTLPARAVDFTKAIRIDPGGGWSEIWYLPVAVGGNLTLTVASAATSYLTIFAAEFSGVASSSPLRATATATAGVTAVTTLTTGALAASAGDLVVSCLGLTGSGGTLTWPNGETTIGNAMNSGGSFESGALGYMIANGAGSGRQANWTIGSGYDSLTAASFRAAPDFAGRRPSRPGRFRRPAY